MLLLAQPNAWDLEACMLKQILVCGPCMLTSIAQGRQPVQGPTQHTVLPKPIWSAKMPLMPFWYNEISHFTPFNW